MTFDRLAWQREHRRRNANSDIGNMEWVTMSENSRRGALARHNKN